MIKHEESKEMNIAPRGRIKIVAKKIWIKGEPMYEIMHVEAAKLNELPETYLHTAPYCYLDSGGNVLHSYGHLYFGDEPKYRVLEVGKVYTIKDYTEFVEIAKKAGEHLTALMEMYQGVFYKGWSGDQVDII